MSTVAVIVALLVSLAATYNAYVLRGGKLAWSQVILAFGTITLMFSLILPHSNTVTTFLARTGILGKLTFELLFILGLLLILVSSLKLRYSLK
ncbi:hypothetical protein A2870_02020 [Candidatus Curtissbacteria bacterium RIFCSPHIGHO2_01_FULL_41_11]|uniref:Uncharacterized protein n=1 Tax=Candidatus Curtissbacteria bacterium RIFCSPHIGHO2_01_FULL_41_11 TaxID=1797711 RepID=A0A1F5G3U2_9BACT|nr:MAG: hypothetical protein A2870_02020 [Candidatus Curtissbacteria bacterium RIFCSPHIGHO2_01_FULL_41_11]